MDAKRLVRDGSRYVLLPSPARRLPRVLVPPAGGFFLPILYPVCSQGLIRRRLATLERGTFASPAYISRFGIPASVDALEADGHRIVGRYAPDAPEVVPFSFWVDGNSRRLSLPSFITVTGPETKVASFRYRAIAPPPSWRPASSSKCCRSFPRRRRRSMSSIRTPGICRRA
jgi:hypothetical protein